MHFTVHNTRSGLESYCAWLLFVEFSTLFAAALVVIFCGLGLYTRALLIVVICAISNVLSWAI